MNDDERFPRLPQDPAYWDELAGRATRAAFRAGQAPWWSAVSDAAPALTAAAVIALLFGSLFLAPRSARRGSVSDVITGALHPDDAMLERLLLAPAAAPPPSVLVDLIALREARR